MDLYGNYFLRGWVLIKLVMINMLFNIVSVGIVGVVIIVVIVGNVIVVYVLIKWRKVFFRNYLIY